MEERVDAQQAVAGQGHPLRAQVGEEAFRLQRGELRREPLERIDAVLVVKISRPDAAALQLQDEFANQPFVVVRPIGTAERQVAFIQCLAESA